MAGNWPGGDWMECPALCIAEACTVRGHTFLLNWYHQQGYGQVSPSGLGYSKVEKERMKQRGEIKLGNSTGGERKSDNFRLGMKSKKWSVQTYTFYCNAHGWPAFAYILYKGDPDFTK